MSLAVFTLAAATAFNLVCTGNLETSSILGKETTKYSIIYRIDLDAGKWCDGECKAPEKIAEIQPAKFILQSSAGQTPPPVVRVTNVIDRETGTHNIFGSSGYGASAIVMHWSGVCEKADFTGFPTVETKF